MRTRRPTEERREPARPVPALIVEAWHTECGACGYGDGGWVRTPARRGNPILTPESRVCPGCRVAFARVVDVQAGTVLVLPVDRAA
jgi:hypothetical protein